MWNGNDLDRILAALGFAVTTEAIERVQSRMNDLALSSATAVTRVQTYLAVLDEIEAQIETARNVAGSPLSQLRSEARRHAGLIARALNLTVQFDAWS